MSRIMRRGALSVLGAICLSLIPQARAQDLSWGSQAQAQGLPDAPSAIVRQPDGSYCIGSTCGWKQADIPPAPPTFFTFRQSWTAPPLRTNRQAFDKKFIVLHAIAWTAAIVACRRNLYTESGSGGTGHNTCWGSEVPGMIAVTALDYAMTRLVSESLSVEAPVYAIAHYARSAAQ